MRGTTERATVAVARCGSYDREEVGAAVRRVLDRLGGMRRFVSPGETVLLKPNLLSAKDPERAITTHPSVLEALIEAVREAGGEPSLGDSPGGALRGVERVWRNTGLRDLSDRTGVPLVNFEASGSVERKGELRSYMIAGPVVAADAIISVPKMKTHVLTLYTGCIKNMYGAIPGFAKGRLHQIAPRPVPFSRHVVDVFSLVTPRLSIMDAVVAMEGDGPSGGSPRHVGAIIGGDDAVAVDAVVARMMGYRDGQVATTRIAAERGLGVADRDRIEIVGDDPSTLDLDGFELPGTTMLNMIPGFLVKALKPWIWIWPEMSKERGCRAEACGLCVRSCPAEAIEMTADGPVVDRRRCVECLCCHEVCPEDAVEIRLSWLARKFA
jgi:uncharacterized protein (DUF362 family)/Pyruvate/2-oxoacid:ferredoxin oxidoreductase delta subunit